VRDGGCRVCGTRSASLHLHEIVYRSKTRGLPMEQRVNMVNCVLLCEAHHAEIHAHRLEVVILDPTEGANGRLEFKPRT
jgi:hypothetical protein